MMTHEVWITGMGAVTAAGVGLDPLSTMLHDGTSGVRRAPDLGSLPVGRAPDPSIPRAARRLDRSARFFLTAALEAWQNAGLEDEPVNATRCGVIEGSSLGPIAELLDAYREQLAEPGAWIRPTALIRFMTGAGGAAFSQLQDLHGPVLHVSAGSVSAVCAIGEAFQKISAGLVDLMVTGGAECPLQADVVNNFRAAGVITRDGVCRPFDARRSGTVLGEGAGVLVLEAAEHARRRGAAPLGAVTGYGFASEAYSMISPQPDGTGVAIAAQQALASGNGTPVGWIKTHGTGTPANDAAECNGLTAVFGDRLSAIPLTSLKPILGHCLGASGAVEGVAAVLALNGGFIPATLDLEELDPLLPPCTVQRTFEESEAKKVLLLAESFGGRCAALLIEKL